MYGLLTQIRDLQSAHSNPLTYWLPFLGSLISLACNFRLTWSQQRSNHLHDLELAKFKRELNDESRQRGLLEVLNMEEIKKARNEINELRNQALDMLGTFVQLTKDAPHLDDDSLVREVTSALQSHAKFKASYSLAGRHIEDEKRKAVIEGVDDDVVQLVLDLARDHSTRKSDVHITEMDSHRTKLGKRKKDVREALGSYLPGGFTGWVPSLAATG